MKFRNNPFSRFYVKREQNFRGNHGNRRTDMHTGILLRVFSFITLLERVQTKFGVIWTNVQTKP